MKQDGIAYSFDQKGNFIGVYRAHLDQVTGEFLLPALATWIKPPEMVPGKRLVFDGEKWNYVDVEKTMPIKAVVEDTPKPVDPRTDLIILDQMLENWKKQLSVEVNKKLSDVESAMIARIERQMRPVIEGWTHNKPFVEALEKRMGEIEGVKNAHAQQIENAHVRLTQLAQFVEAALKKDQPEFEKQRIQTVEEARKLYEEKVEKGLITQAQVAQVLDRVDEKGVPLWKKILTFGLAK